MVVEHILILAISSLGVIHGISLGFYLLLTSKVKPLANRLLGVLLIIFGVRISKSIFLYFTPDLSFLLITLGLSLILSFGPLFYFYVRSFLKEAFTLKKSHLWHAIPFTAFFVLNSFGLLKKEFYLYFGIYFIYLHFLTYIIVAYLWQRKQWSTLRSNNLKLKKQWVSFIHLGIVFIWVSYFMFLLDEIVPYIAGPVTYSLVIYPLSFWAIANKVLQPEEKKYQNSRLDSHEAQQLIDQLETYMKEEQPFLNPDMKLSMLAAQLKTTPHALSQAVNENFQQNFQLYLNTYRIQAAQEMLDSDAHDHLTISAIALDCGFNSLSVFNTAFKKILQTTPSQYRKAKNQQA